MLPLGIGNGDFQVGVRNGLVLGWQPATLIQSVHSSVAITSPTSMLTVPSEEARPV